MKRYVGLIGPLVAVAVLFIVYQTSFQDQSFSDVLTDGTFWMLLIVAGIPVAGLVALVRRDGSVAEGLERERRDFGTTDVSDDR